MRLIFTVAFLLVGIAAPAQQAVVALERIDKPESQAAELAEINQRVVMLNQQMIQIAAILEEIKAMTPAGRK